MQKKQKLQNLNNLNKMLNTALLQLDHLSLVLDLIGDSLILQYCTDNNCASWGRRSRDPTATIYRFRALL